MKELMRASVIAAAMCGFSQTTATATDGSTTVTATAVTVPPVAGAMATADASASATATVNVQVQVPLPKPPPPPESEKPQAILPFRVCVMEFTTIDTQGKIRFIDPANKELDVAPRCTLNDADRTSVNDVMQGFVRLVDAVENHKSKDIKNAITRSDAIDIWNTVMHGQTRPAVIGAEYLESYLGRNGEVFACLDRPLMVAAMRKLQADPEFPTDFQLKLAKATGTTHLIYGTVGNITSRENSFSGYGISTKTTNYALDVIVKMVDLVTQQTVYSNTYTGNYREQRPISGSQFDNNIFQSLMKSALQQAADDLYDRCRPGRNNSIRVTPLPDGVGSEEWRVKSEELKVKSQKGNDLETIKRNDKTMKKILAITMSAAAMLAGAKDKIGIAEPAVGSNFSKDDALAIWDELEASFHSPEYILISRASLKQIMTEIGLTTSSDLLNMNSSQKAKLGQIEGLKYLIVPSLRKLGTRITLTLKTVESSTGEVDQERFATLKATSLDEISDKLEVTLADMLRNDKNGTTVARSSKKCALLTPVIKFDPAPGYLQGDFNTWMQSALLSKGIQLANLADVSRFQKAGLTEMTDRDYAVLGRELRVACLIQFEITEFAIIDVPWASPETGASGHTYSGRFRARMKVVDANDGSLVDACPVLYDSFLGKTSNGMPPPPVESWAEQMIMKAVMEVIVPRLEQVLPRFGGRGWGMVKFGGSMVSGNAERPRRNLQREKSSFKSSVSAEECSGDLQNGYKNVTEKSRNFHTKKCVLLPPMMKTSGMSEYLYKDFNLWVRSALVSEGFAIDSLVILPSKSMIKTDELECRDFIDLGKKYGVDFFMQTEIVDFRIDHKNKSSRHFGRCCAQVKVVSAFDGMVVDSWSIAWDKEL